MNFFINFWSFQYTEHTLVCFTTHTTLCKDVLFSTFLTSTTVRNVYKSFMLLKKSVYIFLICANIEMCLLFQSPDMAAWQNDYLQG